MQLNIKNPETVSLAKELSALMNKPVTQVLTEALRACESRASNQHDPFEARLQGRSHDQGISAKGHTPGA